MKSRKSKVHFDHFGRVFDPKKESFSGFIRSLPKILVAQDLQALVDDVVGSARRRKPVIALIGAHVVKVGLSPLLIDLVKRKIINCIGMNSAAAIHDVEVAMWGKTTEDVEVNLADGSFGMAVETGEFINGTLTRGMANDRAGYGEVLGKALRNAPNRKLSILAACQSLGVPVTVHAAIGTDRKSTRLNSSHIP